MAEIYTFKCNIANCRVILRDQAVVTTCSHIYCTSCANQAGLTNPDGTLRQCPACQTTLNHVDDCVVNCLNPTEDYKTSILSGLTPDLILECAARAMQFYTYQTSQEVNYSDELIQYLKDKYTRKSNQLHATMLQANSEIQSLNEMLNSKQIAISNLENKLQDLGHAFNEKNKALQETQHRYHHLKSRFISVDQQQAASEESNFTIHESPQKIWQNNSKIPVLSPTLHLRGVKLTDTVRTQRTSHLGQKPPFGMTPKFRHVSAKDSVLSNLDLNISIPDTQQRRRIPMTRNSTLRNSGTKNHFLPSQSLNNLQNSTRKSKFGNIPGYSGGRTNHVINSKNIFDTSTSESLFI